MSPEAPDIVKRCEAAADKLSAQAALFTETSSALVVVTSQRDHLLTLVEMLLASKQVNPCATVVQVAQQYVERVTQSIRCERPRMAAMQ